MVVHVHVLQISKDTKKARVTASRTLHAALATNHAALYAVRSFAVLLPAETQHAHHYTGPVCTQLFI